MSKNSIACFKVKRKKEEEEEVAHIRLHFFFNTKLNKTISTFIVNENLLRIHDYRVLKKRIRKK